MRRREFIILTGVGATGTTLLSACSHPEEKLIPALIPDDQYVPGVDYWKASTCGMCSAGCGILVRTREHKANKIEGNPLHPVNMGGLCAKGQAGLEVLYNPDRIKGPMKRVGERGEGKWQEISWEEAIKTLAQKLGEIQESDQAVFITTDGNGITAHVANRLMETLHQQMAVVPPVFGELVNDTDPSQGEPIYDLANSTFLISFGARFLETWHSPVRYSSEFGHFRSADGKPRGRFVHVEPRLSLTGANADEWLAPVPGTEGLLALAMAQVIVRESLNKTPIPSKVLDPFSPEKTETITDISAHRVTKVAWDFAKAERPLAIGSLSKPSLAAVNLLNQLVANPERKSGVMVPEKMNPDADPFRNLAPSKDFAALSYSGFRERLKLKEPRVLMVHNFNPVFASEVESEISNVPFIASFSSFVDETTALADLVLPDHTYLERWDAHSRLTPALTLALTQPVIEPQLNTRQTADVLLEVARMLGGEPAKQLQFASAKEVVQRGVANIPLPFRRPMTLAESVITSIPGSKEAGSREELRNRLLENGVAAENGQPSQTTIGDPQATSIPPEVLKSFETPKATTKEQLWNKLLERGVAIEDEQPKQTKQTTSVPPEVLKSFEALKTTATETHDSSLTLILYEHATMGDGSFANLPSLQELPDPMSSVVWGTWLEMNPKTAASQGIADGDLVEVAFESGSLRVPVLLYPAIRPDTIAMPVGQGHKDFGRYATNRGLNPLRLLPAEKISQLEPISGVKVTRVGSRGELIRFGTELMQQMETKR